MNVERGPEAFLKKLVLAIALTASFLFYVTFVQIPLFKEAFAEGRSVFPLFIFGFLGGLGCLLAGRVVDLVAERTAWMLPAICACMALEGIYGLAWPHLEAGFPALGFVLGAHIVFLFILLGRGLGPADRALVAATSFAGIYLLANVLMVVEGRWGADGGALLGCVGGTVILFAGIACFLGYRTGMIRPAPPEWIEAPSASGARTIAALAPLFFLIALDSYTFYGVLSGRATSARLLPTPGSWLANGAWHVLAAPVALAVLLRFGRRATLAFSALAFAAFLAVFHGLPGAGIHVPLLFYSLFVAGYSLVLFTVWPSVRLAEREGRVTALGMLICGFGGSVGGIGLYLAVWG